MLEDGKSQAVSNLQDQEYVDSMRQEMSVVRRGGDPFHERDGTELLSPAVAAMRDRRLMGEKIGKMESLVAENKPEIDELRNLWQTKLQMFKQANSQTLAQLGQLTQEESAQRMQFVRMGASEMGGIQQRLAKLNQRFKEIDPSFSVFTHPETQGFAKGLGNATSDASIFQTEGDPSAGFLGQVGGDIATVLFEGVDAAVEGFAAPLKNIGEAGALFGDMVLRGVLSEDKYNEVKSHISAKTGWDPDMMQAHGAVVRDENGREVTVNPRFGIPELISPLGATLFGKHASELAENARDAERIWSEYGRGGKLWGVAGDVSNFVGGLMGMSKATAPVTGVLMKAKGAIATGMGFVGARASTRAAKIYNVIGGITAESASMGIYEGFAYGRVDGYADSFGRGAETGAMFWALGGLGGSTEKLLLRRKMPSFLSQQVSAALEGTGMMAYGKGKELFGDTEAGRSLWRFLQEPETKTWNDYRDTWAKDVAGMMVFKAMFGKDARRSSLYEVKVAEPERKAAEEKRVALEEAGKRRVGESVAQALVDLKEGNQDAPMQSFYLSRYAKEVAPLAQEMGRRGRTEAALTAGRGAPPDVGVPGTLSGSARLDMPENLAERLIKGGQQRTARDLYDEKTGKPKAAIEWGAAGMHIGGKMFFSPVKGNREILNEKGEQVRGPTVQLSTAKSRLAKQLLETGQFSPEEVQRRMETGDHFTLHHHPSGGSFSGTDLAIWKGMASSTGDIQTGNAPQFVFTDRGIFSSTPMRETVGTKEGVAKLEENQANIEEHIQGERGMVAGEIGDALKSGEGLKKFLGGDTFTDKEQVELAGIYDKNPEAFVSEMRSAESKYYKRAKLKTREEKLLGRLGQVVVYGEAVRRAGEAAGLKITYDEGRQAIDKWGAFQKTGDISVFGGEKHKAVGEQETERYEATDRFEKEFGLRPREPLYAGPKSELKREQAANAYRSMQDELSKAGESVTDFLSTGQRRPDVAQNAASTSHEIAGKLLQEMGKLYGEEFDALEPSPQNVAAAMRFAGIDTGMKEAFTERGKIRRDAPTPESFGETTEKRGEQWSEQRVIDKVRDMRELNEEEVPELAKALDGVSTRNRAETTSMVLEWARDRYDDHVEQGLAVDVPASGAYGVRLNADVPLSPDTLNLAQAVLGRLYGASAPKLPGAAKAARIRDFEPGSTPAPSDPEMASMRREQENLANADQPAAGRGELSPQQADTVLKKMLGVESELTKSTQSTFQRMKGAASKVANSLGGFFRDPSAREMVAERVEKLGYRSKFLGLKEDEDFVLAETDRVRTQIGEAPRLAMGDLAGIYEPIAKKEGTWQDRKAELADVQAYAVLNDLYSNYLRTRRVHETNEKGEPVFDERGEPKMVEQEYTTELPGGVSIEDVKRNLDEVHARLTPEGKEAYSRLRQVLDEAFNSMVARGLTTEASFQQNYFPRRVFDYADALEAMGPSKKLLTKEPFRGFLEARKGTARLLDPRLEALESYLSRVRITNAVHDYNVRVSEGIQDRLFNEHGLTPESIQAMTPDEWATTYDRLEKEEGLVTVDIKRGKTGKQTLERDPVFTDMMADIWQQAGVALVPEAVIGRDIRPDAADGRFLITKKALEFFRESRERTAWLANPALGWMRKQIGKWFKGPALRGFLGLRVPLRAARNLFSDVTAIAFKGGEGALGALRETTKYFKDAHLISKALANKNQQAAVEELSPYLQSVAAEFNTYSTGKSGFWTSDTDFVRAQREGEFLKRMMPETTNWLGEISRWARGDFEWARKMDDYAENLVRVAYFMRERLARFQQFEESPELMRPGETAETAATRAAHIKSGEVLVNYNWLTPGERVAFNGLLFPFYTWAKSNFTRTLAETIRRPMPMIGKYAAYTGMFSLWNWMMSADDEQRLVQLRPDLAGKGHLFLPWLKDEYGNSSILTFEDTFTEAARFLGFPGIFQKAGAFLGHGDPDLFLRDALVGGYDSAKKSFRDWTNPLLRGALDFGYASKFETFGERAEAAGPSALRSFLPAADIGQFLNVNKDQSWQERLLTPAPMVGFLDLTKGIPMSQQAAQFQAGRIQRREAQVADVIRGNLTRFISGLKQGEVGMMRDAVDRVWGSVGENMAEGGMTQYHLWARMIRAAERELKRQTTAEIGGKLPPKFWELSKSQQAELLMRLAR